MKDIIIIANFTQVPGEKGNSRFNYLANRLANYNNYKVELVTSNFSHRTKKKRNVGKDELTKLNYKLTLLEESGYYKNVSLKRFYSHYIMGKSVYQYLLQRKKPDIIYCAIPSLDVANAALKYAKKNNIEFIIDIQDLWPEAFKMVFKFPIISDIIFWPMNKMANKIYKNADKIIAVSDTYVDRALKVSKKCSYGLSAYLGTDLEYFDKLAIQHKIERNDNDFWITYIGTLGHSYDIKLVIDALKIVKEQGINNIIFKVIGDGPLKKEFEEYALKKEVKCDFTGRVEYGEMVGLLVKSDLAINPITKGTAASIINKVGDYAAAKIPVINTQDCIEYRELIDKYKCGFNCNNANEMADIIVNLYNNRQIIRVIGENNRQLAIDKFDRNKTYNEIIKNIQGE